MLKKTLVILTAIILFYQNGVWADADMFRPFEREIKTKNMGSDWTSGNEGFIWDHETYVTQRPIQSNYYKKERYFRRHCGNAYVNCMYPDDYPRYNGEPYYPPRR